MNVLEGLFFLRKTAFNNEVIGKIASQVEPGFYYCEIMTMDQRTIDRVIYTIQEMTKWGFFNDFESAKSRAKNEIPNFILKKTA